MSVGLLFGGDIVIADGVVNDKLCSDEFESIIKECDVVCCNFEAPIIENGTAKKKVGPNNNNSKNTIHLLKDAGFNLFTLANNHVFDYGVEGIEDTIGEINNNKINHIGAGITAESIYEPYIYEKEDVRIGIINFAENGFGAALEGDKYGYAYLFIENRKHLITDLKEKCDYVIVVCHAGAEMWDYPLPEWRKEYKSIIDEGADVIIAHHPHVPQGYEEYKGKPIFYSLGNLAFDKGKGAKKPETICVKLVADKQSVSYEIINTVFRNSQIQINQSEQFVEHFRKSCDILKDDEKYIKAVDEKCVDMYKRIYRNYYERIACKYRGGIKEKMKSVAKKLIVKNSFQDIWLYHNISIETHLFICKRAVRILLKKEEIL